MPNALFDEVTTCLAPWEVGELRQQWQEVTCSSQARSKQELRDAYRSGVALVLGAGVSMDAGVPSWSRLLSNIVMGIVHRKLEPGQPVGPSYQPFTSVLERCLPGDPLVVAHYAEIAHKALGTPFPFLEIVRNELYARVGAVSPTSVLGAIANVVRGHARQAARGVVSVVTYNFDTLLEEELAAVGCPFDAPKRNERALGLSIPIYHPHGIVHRRECPAPDDWTILVERDYHAEFAMPHSWSNIVQLNAFSQMRCVFIGLSMTDPNLRRLLGAAKPQNSGPHYAFLRRSQVDDLRRRLDSEYSWSKGHKASKKENEDVTERLRLACEGGDAAVHLTLQALGVETIWFDSFAELPSLVLAMAQ